MVEVLGSFYSFFSFLVFGVFLAFSKKISVNLSLAFVFLLLGVVFFFLSPNGALVALLVTKMFLGLTIGRNLEVIFPTSIKLLLALMLISISLMAFSTNRNDYVNFNFIVVWCLITISMFLSSWRVISLGTIVTVLSASRTGFVGLLILLFGQRSSQQYALFGKLALICIFFLLTFAFNERIFSFFDLILSNQVNSIDSFSGFDGSKSARIRLTQAALLIDNYQLWIFRGFDLQELEAIFHTNDGLSTTAFLHSSILLLLAAGGVFFFISIFVLLAFYVKASLCKLNIPFLLIVSVAFASTMAVDKLYFWIAVGGALEAISRKSYKSASQYE